MKSQQNNQNITHFNIIKNTVLQKWLLQKIQIPSVLLGSR